MWDKKLDWAAGLTIAAAGVFVVGFMEATSYYTKLGVPEGALDFSFHFLAMRSIFALPPLLVVGLAAFAAREAAPRLSRAFAKRRTKRPFYPVRLPAIYVITWTATVAVVATFLLRDGTLVVWLGSPREYWVAAAIVFCGIIGWTLVNPRSPLSRRPSHFGVAFLALLSVLFCMLAAGFMGMNRASEVIEGCGYRSYAEFTPGLEVLEGQRHWIVYQEGTNLWLRRDSSSADSSQVTFVAVLPGTTVRIDKDWPDETKCR